LKSCDSEQAILVVTSMIYTDILNGTAPSICGC